MITRRDCGFEADAEFGPAVASCRREFDFTLFFEAVVFGLIPSSGFILLSIVRLVYLRHHAVVARYGVLYYLKIAGSLALAVAQFAIIGVQVHSKDITAASIPDAALAAIATCFILLLSHFEHLRSRRPSSLLICYLALTVLLHAARVRTLWLDDITGLAAVVSSSLAIRILVLVLECTTKRGVLIIQNDANLPAEVLAGVISRTVFQWLNSVLIKGYRQLLRPEDIGPIDEALLTVKLREDSLYVPAIARLAVTAFTFSQPYLVQAALNYLEADDSTPASHGYGLIGAAFLCYAGIAAANSWYWHQAYRCGVMVRGGLSIAIFQKLLTLPAGDDGIESLTTTLMIGDLQRIMNATIKIHEVWAAVLETGLATWLLYLQVGPSGFVMLGIAISAGIASSQLLKATSRNQQRWLAGTQERLKHTKNMLASLKAIKMMSEEEKVFQAISNLRALEIKGSAPFRRSLVGSAVLSYSTMILSPPLVLAVYISTASSNSNFNVSTVFTALTVISLLSSPLVYVFQIIPTLGAAHGCFGRVQNYLRRQEKSPSETSNPIPDSETHNEKTMLSARGLSLGWKPESPLLSVDLDVHEGEKIAIMGAVGCGKSLLLKGLLGEAERIAGDLHVAPSVRFAYCSQTPWVENVSVLENLTQNVTETVTPADIAKIKRECALEDLFELGLLQNSNTIGSNGAALSGGQRQRLITLLDDTFSALDRNTRRRVAGNILGRGTRSRPRTIIYVTNDNELAALADRIYRIDDTGKLISDVLEPARDDAGIEEVMPENQETSDQEKAAEKEATAGSAAKGGQSPQEVKRSIPVTREREVYIKYFRSIGPVHAGLFMLGVICWSLAYKMSDVWVGWWTDAYANGDNRNTYWLCTYTAFGIAALVALCVWLSLSYSNSDIFDSHQQFFLIARSSLILHNQLVKTVLNAQFPIISRIDTGTILNRLNQDLMFVDLQLPMDLFNTAPELCIAIIQIVLIGVASLPALCTAPAMFIILYIVQHVYLRTSKQLRTQELEAKAGLHTIIAESSSGLITIRANSWVVPVVNNFRRRLDRSQEPLYILYAVQRWLQLVMNLTVAGLMTVVLGVSVALKQKHAISTGSIGVAFLNAVTLGETLTNLVVSWTSLQTSLGAIDRMVSFEREVPGETNDGAEPDQAVGINTSLRPATKDTGTDTAIHLENVWATYGDADNTPSTDVVWGLRSVNLDIRRGERITICGKTGSGKSTLHLALLRMVNLPIGSILINGIEQSGMSLRALRSKFCVISQDRLHSASTLRDELDPLHSVTDERVEQVLQDCGVLDVVNKAGGINTSRADCKFSEGEEQLLSIARVIIQANKSGDDRIILLDEISSSIDAESEAHIEQLIQTRLAGRTIIAINHRLEAALKYDRIVILDQGQIADVGTPSQILERSSLFVGLESKNIPQN
ncbi:putative ATP-binding cassette transporter [Xylariales sp. PMI_506]|nr:putative ATP-binding cassette transporter [Xylariales sp. PMI_506]